MSKVFGPGDVVRPLTALKIGVVLAQNTSGIVAVEWGDGTFTQEQPFNLLLLGATHNGTVPVVPNAIELGTGAAGGLQNPGNLGPGGGLSQPVPNGPIGTQWTLAWNDEFTGTSLDTTKWFVYTDSRQGVTCSAGNIAVSGGYLRMTLASSTSGAMINNYGTQDATTPSNGYGLAYGDCVEISASFPGTAFNNGVYNWPALWTSGHTTSGDISGGELDFAECLSGELTINYHNTTGTFAGPTPTGVWTNNFHTYTLVRNSPSNAAIYQVWYDGVLQETTPSENENGALQGVLIASGYKANTGGALHAGAVLLVDYVRIWTPG